MQDESVLRVTLIALASLTMIWACQAACSPCRFKWQEHQQHCYRFFPDLLSFDEAEAYCRRYATRGEEGDLLVGNSPDETVFLMYYAESIFRDNTTCDASPYVWLGKKVDIPFETYNMIYYNSLGTTAATIGHFTSCDAYDSPIAISKSSEGTGVSKMIPAPDVVEQKCSVYVGDGAFINLGDFAGTCVSDPDVCTSESVTWSLWIKINSSADLTHNNGYFSTGGHTKGARGILFIFTAQKEYPFEVYVRLQRKQSVLQKFNVSKIPMDKWVHLTIALDMNHTNAKMAVYLDGKKLTADYEDDIFLKSLNDGCTRLVLGNFDSCGATGPLVSSASAAYSNLMVFDHLLTEEQIVNIHACGSLDWGLKIRSLYVDSNMNSGNLRYVCTASASTGPTIYWSVYHKERVEWQDLGSNSTKEGYKITPTSFSPCVVQSTLVIDQAHGLIAEGDIVTCTAISSAQNASVHTLQGEGVTVGLYKGNGNAGLFVANTEEEYNQRFERIGDDWEDCYPFICKSARRYP